MKKEEIQMKDEKDEFEKRQIAWKNIKKGAVKEVTVVIEGKTFKAKPLRFVSLECDEEGELYEPTAYIPTDADTYVLGQIEAESTMDSSDAFVLGYGMDSTYTHYIPVLYLKTIGK